MDKQGSFLYFVEGKNWEQITAEFLAGNSLLAAPFFEQVHSPLAFKRRTMRVDVQRGPKGQQGCIIVPQPQVDVGQLPTYREAEQTWIRIGDTGVWIGWDNAMRPGPDSLRRGNQMEGYEVPLGDQNIWICPVVLSFDELTDKWASHLPVVFSIDSEGETITKTPTRFLPHRDAALKIANVVFGVAGNGVTNMEAIDLATLMLSLNYRIGPTETAILEILNTENMVEVLHASCDVLQPAA